MAATVLIISLLAVPAQADLAWSIQIIDSSSSYLHGIIALDSDDNPCIVYTHMAKSFGDTRGYAMYARWDGAKWNTENITQGYVFDIKLRSGDTPCILYASESEPYASNHTMVFADWTGTQWNTKTVTTDYSTCASLAIDSGGSPHIVYQGYSTDGNNGNLATLEYAFLNGSKWQIQRVDSQAAYGYPVYLALDSDNKPHITYSCNNPDGSQTVKYASIKDARWDIQAPFTNLLAYGNLVLDSNNYPCFTFVENTGTILTYACWDGLNWTTRMVDSNVRDGSGYLALDKNDYPHIDYQTEGYNHANSSLIYASWTGTEWNIQKVAPNSKAYANGPIAVDSNGYPHITYLGSQSGEVERTVYCMYATPNGETQPIKTEAPTQPSMSTDILLIALPVAGVAVAVLISAFLWKGGRIERHRKNQ